MYIYIILYIYIEREREPVLAGISLNTLKLSNVLMLFHIECICAMVIAWVNCHGSWAPTYEQGYGVFRVFLYSFPLNQYIANGISCYEWPYHIYPMFSNLNMAHIVLIRFLRARGIHFLRFPSISNTSKRNPTIECSLRIIIPTVGAPQYHSFNQFLSVSFDYQWIGSIQFQWTYRFIILNLL